MGGLLNGNFKGNKRKVCLKGKSQQLQLSIIFPATFQHFQTHTHNNHNIIYIYIYIFITKVATVLTYLQRGALTDLLVLATKKQHKHKEPNPFGNITKSIW